MEETTKPVESTVAESPAVEKTVSEAPAFLEEDDRGGGKPRTTSVFSAFCGKWLSGLAFLAIGAQCVHLLVKDAPYCVNEASAQGCRIMGEASPLTPLNTNLAGLVFFGILFALFHCVQKRRGGGGLANFFLNTALLVGMAVEGVLFLFQYQIFTKYQDPNVFCLYCLAILAVLVLINLLQGPKQFFAALLVFGAVCVGNFLMTDPKGVIPGVGAQHVSVGTAALKQGPAGGDMRYFFFKEDCVHCKEVLAELLRDNSATLHLNPLATLKKLTLPGTKAMQGFQPDVNRTFLHSLGIDTVPVLVVQRQDGSGGVYQGKVQIASYLQEGIRDTGAPSPPKSVQPPPAPKAPEPAPAPAAEAPSRSQETPAAPVGQPQADSCGVDDKDCKQ